MKMNSLLRHQSATYFGAFAVLMLLVVLSPKATQGQTTTVSIGLGLEQPPVLVEIAPLPAQASLEEYTRLGEKSGVRAEEKLVILVVTFTNLVDIPVETSLGDIVPITGTTRHLFIAYLGEAPQTGRPAYTLPTWDTILRVPPKASVTLRLAFIVEHGEHTVFEKSLRIFACFSHEILGGVCHSLAWSHLTQTKPDSQSLEKGASSETSKDGVRQQPLTVDFDISESVTPEAVRLLRFPMTPLSRGGPSLFVESFLGDRGQDSKYPYWFDICLAAADGQFDYSTAVRYLHLLAIYKSAYPSGLARDAVWLQDQNLLLTPTKHRVYVASAVWGVCTLPHEVAEVLLYVASESLTFGIDPTHLVPLPGTYKPLLDNGHKGFELGLNDTSLKAVSTGIGYEIEISRSAGASPISLVYIRKRAAEE